MLKWISVLVRSQTVERGQLLAKWSNTVEDVIYRRALEVGIQVLYEEAVKDLQSYLQYSSEMQDDMDIRPLTGPPPT